ncbi:hypothetical protein SY88_16630 [Clostridiales bacterium PH28_bin88]|nr:hypothetical protein SY88_16630 [Clostridiales bacterium PH28_bin88]
MKFSKPLALLVLILFSLTLIAGCGGKPTPADKQDSQEQKAPAAAPQQPEKISMAAAPPGGSIYVASSAIAKVLKEKLNIEASIEATGGTVHNYQLVNKGDSKLGFTLTIDSQDGWEGTGKWTNGSKFQDARALVPLYPVFMQMIARPEANIKTAQDLNGKRVWLANAGSGHDSSWRLYFDNMGIKPAAIVNTAPADGSDMFRDGRIDAMGMISTVPVATFSDLESTNKLAFVSIPQAEIEAFMAKNSFAKPGVIKAGSFKQLTEDITTITSYMFLITNKNTDDDLAYRITKAVLENNPALVEGYKKLVDAKVENVDKLNITYHPGAVKYYKEKGINIPSNLLP